MELYARDNSVDPFPVAERFSPQGAEIDISEFGNGNINNTFLVTLDAGGEKRFILQRINTLVFPRPELVMRNIRVSTCHILRRLQYAPRDAGRRWKVPQVLLTREGSDHCIDSEGSFWRALSYIDRSQSFDTVKNTHHAGEVGYALGTFHTLLNDLPPDRLADMLEGFHITPRYLRHYDEVLAKFRGALSAEVNFCLKFVSKRRAWAHILEDAKNLGSLLVRPIHGDPKVNNILMDTDTGHAVSIVDLDTITPGLVHYDIGDCLRSGCNPLGEETELWEAVQFDTDFCRSILQGYFSNAREFLSASDMDYIYDAVRLIAFELGLRFFTDHLEGDVYFKVTRPGHNLARALVQFRLTESIESRATAIRGIIQEAR